MLKKIFNNLVKPESANSKLQTGAAAEQLACSYLQKRGLTFINSNYRCRLGEIDLIMRDADYLVFIEVRYRKQGLAADSVNIYKQRKLIKTAQYYLQQQQLNDKAACRFDVIAINGQEINWIKNAFQC